MADTLATVNDISLNSNLKTVSAKRGYAVVDTEQARNIARDYLDEVGWDLPYEFGLPEIDDRYHIWRVPVVSANGVSFGEIVIDAKTSLVQQSRSTDLDVLRARHPVATKSNMPRTQHQTTIVRSELRNTILLGDAEQTLADLPAGSVDLVFTSPPYFNARPDYTEYEAYEEYLAKMGRVISQCARLLAEGRFFVINVSPVLLRRSNRSQSSKRIAVPFDLHSVITRQGFDFIDDIIWEKPEGAGWATSRGRRFAADRNPLQYKAVPVTEYVLVYRKHTNKLIDWNIRKHPDQQAVKDSKIEGEYERTNVWKISPTSTKDHPAVFPTELADRVVKYYSFKGDVVLDPFAGSGTLGRACAINDRRFVLAEISETYIDIIKRNAVQWLGNQAREIRCINTSQIWPDTLL